MINLDKIKGIIFDYGATIDTNGIHWTEVIWDAYKNNQVPITKDFFLKAYIYSECYLSEYPIIKFGYTFKELLLVKIHLQIKWLINKGFLVKNIDSLEYAFVISNDCYFFVKSVLVKVRPILQNLVNKYPLVLVSNFYGNIKTVLKDFGLDFFFKKVIESAIVKIRKPNPLIFNLGIEALKLAPETVVVIGDSYEKDIFPAQIIGCQTIWIKNIFEEGIADVIIHDFKELNTIFKQKDKI